MTVAWASCRGVAAGGGFHGHNHTCVCGATHLAVLTVGVLPPFQNIRCFSIVKQIYLDIF
jgi:hypothetical protein